MRDLKIDPKAQLVLWFLVAFSVALYLLGKQISQEQIQSFVENAGPWAPIVWILTHQLSYILAPISGYPFLIIGFYLFGKTTILYTFIVAIFGSTINFLIAKRWGRPIVKRFVGKESLSKTDAYANQYGLGTLFVLRMFMVGLGDFISYAYGLTPITYRTYITVSVIAMIPGYLLWYLVASWTNNIEQFLSTSVALTFIASGIFIGGTYFWRKLKNKR